MANNSGSNLNNSLANNNFPAVINGRINIVEFLKSASDLVCVVERLGTVFAPVKYDMQGNIDKIKKNLNYDKNSCLLELMQHEVSKEKPRVALDSLLWLNRALLYFELLFEEILKHLRLEKYDVNMKQIFTIAYEGSVKKYHNWVTQQIFHFICKMSPGLPQIMSSFGVGEDVKAFGSRLEGYNISLHLVRCKIDDLFKDNNLFED